MNNQPQLLNKYKWAIFIFCFLLIGWRTFTITTTNGKGRDNVYGDSYSDINTLSAVRYFHENGFTKSAWLPIHLYDGPGDTTWGAYTHYPALPDILAGFYSKILDTTHEPALRIFPILLSMLWFLLIYKVLETLLGDKKQAFIGGTVIVLSNYFIAWADNLHKHALEEILKWLYVYCIYRYFNSERQFKWLALMCIVFVLAINVSFEPATFLAVVSIGFSLLYQRKLFTAATILPGIAAVVGFGLHMWQNAVYL
ncbi:MAG TPA: glycosyltransferase family 39 protein, partial [Bacteroidia bacterium]|nr:glycosyltransferase family 39 protein [Bacteroidia bacterium]